MAPADSSRRGFIGYLCGFAQCAAAALSLLLAPGEAAAVSFTASVGPGGNANNNIGPCAFQGANVQGSPTPVNISVVCGPDGGVSTAGASATFGHVGASASVATVDPVFGQIGATADFLDTQFVFHNNNAPGVPGAVPVSMNVAIDGHVTSTFGAGVLVIFETVINNHVAGFLRLESVGGVLTCTNVTFRNMTSGCSNQVFLARTQDILVPLDTPVGVEFFLTLDASSGGPGASATAEYGNSFDFPVGIDLFNLPEGFTVNARDSFVFDNRFQPPTVATPEPATLGLLCAGVAALGFVRRRTAGEESVSRR